MIRWLLPLVLLAGCGSAAIWTEIDPWYTPLRGQLDDWSPLPSSSFARVTPGKVANAVSMLEQESAISISPSMASSLTDGRLHEEDAWLVRALCLVCDPFDDLVYRRDTAIFVSHAALSKRPLPMQRWPVVVAGVEQIDSVVMDITSYE